MRLPEDVVERAATFLAVLLALLTGIAVYRGGAHNPPRALALATALAALLLAGAALTRARHPRGRSTLGAGLLAAAAINLGGWLLAPDSVQDAPAGRASAIALAGGLGALVLALPSRRQPG